MLNALFVVKRSIRARTQPETYLTSFVFVFDSLFLSSFNTHETKRDVQLPVSLG